MGQRVSRRVIRINGIVQGVGFRPLIFRLASKHHLQGLVRNDSGGLCVEVQGPLPQVESFFEELAARPPVLAKVTDLQWQTCAPRRDQQAFVVSQSQMVADSITFVSPDVATCEDCLAELFDPNNRRYRYPFINCTNCGPRFTILNALPYDRARTTMGSFTLCEACCAEYEDPANRRFHAEPIACPVCGPQLQLLNRDKLVVQSDDTITAAADAIRAGRILALKGLGGFHLVCDARNDHAVLELRRRKRRDEKPFAVMVGDLSAAETLCEISVSERQLLASIERPIVLARKRTPNGIAASVAPDNRYLGLMLPYSPPHHLLLRELSGVPLVMTSGNGSDEPLVFRDEELLPRLGSVADLFLTHDRPIAFRCDDSVVSAVGKLPIFIRRSRGYAPSNLALPVKCRRPILALGGQLKATFALGTHQHAILSHHLGDLDSREAWEEYQRSLEHYQKLFHFVPEVLAYDLHPDYASTRYAYELPGDFRRVPVQHHHAHLASCMAEHGLTDPVIGVTFDGTGCGTDATIWGGEFLVGDYRNYKRAAHLRCLPMPGGERAIREPWRMALAYLCDAGLDAERFLKGVRPQTISRVEEAMHKGINAPLTSSCGRLFDAAAVLLGLRSNISFEGQAAIALESLAAETDAGEVYPFLYENGVIDTRPLIRAITNAIQRQEAPAHIARSIHLTIAEIVVRVCHRLSADFGILDVVLSGGVFMNRTLLREATQRLAEVGLNGYSHRLVPPNDGGLCLGQLAVAAATVT